MPAIEQVQSLSPNHGWQTLKIHYQQMRNLHLRQLFAHDPQRGERFRIEDNGIYFDYSKNLITKETMDNLCQLAESCALPEIIEQKFFTKAEPAEGAAFQWPSRRDDQLAQMTDFARRVWNGEWTGYTGMRMRTLVNIQIDPHEPCPMFAHQALGSFINSGITTLFVTSANSQHFCGLLKDLNPAETLFIVSSDSFTSRETMACAHKARRWVLKAMRDESAVARHFVAASNNAAEVTRFGIEAGSRFSFWNRFAGDVDMKHSTTGLSTMMALGPDIFSRMMSGFTAMDDHFRTTPFARNLPVIAGLLGVWYSNFYGSDKLAVLPYNRLLSPLPAYLKRLSSNYGVRRIIDPCHPTGRIGGEEPTEVQDLLCYRIMQGITICPCDFIGFCSPEEATAEPHNLLMAKMLALTQTLAFGDHEHHLQEKQHSRLPLEGNHPSNTILAKSLTPETFGRLLAFYEHSIFTQETVSRSAFSASLAMGTMSAEHIVHELENGLPTLSQDSSTSCLIRHYRNLR